MICIQVLQERTNYVRTKMFGKKNWSKLMAFFNTGAKA